MVYDVWKFVILSKKIDCALAKYRRGDLKVPKVCSIRILVYQCKYIWFWYYAQDMVLLGMFPTLEFHKFR